MIQRRQAAARERTESTTHASPRGPPAPAHADFRKAIEDAERGNTSNRARCHSWHPQMKTRDAARLRLAAARHLFARYPVCAMLERIWIDDAGLDADEVRLRGIGTSWPRGVVRCTRRAPASG